MPVAGLRGAADEDAGSRSQPIESVRNLAVRQCQLEFSHPFARNFGLGLIPSRDSDFGLS